MRRFSALLFSILVFLLMTSADEPPPTPVAAQEQAELSAAFFRRIEEPSGGELLTFDLFTPEVDTAFISPDGQLAVLWLALRDDTGRVLGTEPGLVVARRVDNVWQVILPGDPGWDETLSAIPLEMLPLEYLPAPESARNSLASNLEAVTGYYLPYAAGSEYWLEGSISHFQSVPSLGYPSCGVNSILYCHYAYDFTDDNHFPLLASKGGTVFSSRDSCPNDQSSCTNYIVIYNASDAAYQIYIHMAQNTIPNSLVNGTSVVRGQYLGDTDDTGYSTSNHVHFMVANNIWVGGDGYYWGYSIDVRFADVTINNGIPRNCYELANFPVYDGATQCQDYYVSGNTGAFPATGTISRPIAGATVAAGTNPLMDATAIVTDDVRVKAVRMVAKLNGVWTEIGPLVTQAASGTMYDWDVNLCDVGPINGPLEVAVRAWDHEGNVSSALDPRTINVDHACPVPVSSILNPAQTMDSTAIYLNWTVPYADASVSSFDLQWRVEPGAWSDVNLLTIPSTQTSTWFVGQAGLTYGFRLRARDTGGQIEPWPANDAPETTIALPASCTPDGYEENDTKDQSKGITQGQSLANNLCESGDQDWFAFNVGQTGDYLAVVTSKGGAASTKMTVYDSNGAVLAAAQSPGLGQNAVARFPAATTGMVYLKIEPLVPNLSGTGALYNLRITDAQVIYLPVIKR